MKQETIGSKGTVPGFRPLIGVERWHRDDFTTEMLSGGWRPFLLGETGSGKLLSSRGSQWYDMCEIQCQCESGPLHNHCQTNRPLPPPAVETFEAHGHIWYKHTPGDGCPVDGECKFLLRYGDVRNAPNGIWTWDARADYDKQVIGYRFPDYPAVHTTLQQEQPFVPPPTATIPTQFSTEQRLTSLYNDWCFLPPETVAECIADVASVLYPTDAERCEAAYWQWHRSLSGPTGSLQCAWDAAWKAAKESK